VLTYWVGAMSSRARSSGSVDRRRLLEFDPEGVGDVLRLDLSDRLHVREARPLTSATPSLRQFPSASTSSFAA
jgi:hypothetical protein